ncbi:MAG: inorganic diphosphatase [bacterium]|nr:inorganic diphosphatase [bacterium]
MKVFIENKAGSNLKSIYNEKTLEFKKTVTVSKKYPFPYGFILNSTSGDGDNLDCFIITNQVLKSGQTIECEPIGIMQQFENGEEDYNILAKLPNEDVVISEEIKKKFTEFILHVFDNKPEIMVTVGEFLSKEEAIKYIDTHFDTDKNINTSKSLNIAKQFLGKEVEIIIDRPLGSRHPEHGFIYKLNYGYLPDTPAPDSKNLDAYYIGTDQPQERVQGIAVAIIHRLEDDDDKLVIIPSGTNITDEEIEQAVEFQEKWFKHEIIRNGILK